MRIAVGADNRGLGVRDHIRDLLQRFGHEVEEVGGPEYPDIASQVARRVRQAKADRGILIARTGMGMCIVANRFWGVRAAVCFDEFMAEMSRRYLDVNVLCLSGELLDKEHAEKIVEVWLNTPFEGGRHARRIDKISVIERQGPANESERHDNE